jgi:hypothetical protein
MGPRRVQSGHQTGTEGVIHGDPSFFPGEVSGEVPGEILDVVVGGVGIHRATGFWTWTVASYR